MGNVGLWLRAKAHLLIIGGALLFIGLLGILGILSCVVYANQLDWLSATEPTVVKKDAKIPTQSEYTYRTQPFCNEQIVTLVNGYATPSPTKTKQKLCIVQGKSIRISSYNSTDGTGLRLAIGFGSDQNMYVTNVTNSSAWHLIPGTDVAVESIFANWDSLGIAVHKDLHHTFAADSSSLPGFPKYQFVNNSSQYHILREGTNNGRIVGVYGYGFSNNGRYVGMLTDSGYAVLDLETYQTRVISQANSSLRPDANHEISLTVSDDGRYMAGGMGLSMWIWDISGSCGGSSNETIQNNTVTGCPYRDITIDEPSDNRTMFYHYSFSNDNGQLRFYSDTVNGTHFITVTAPGYSPPTQLDYLALGDSYSSGEGDTEKNPATNQKYYRPHTDVNGAQNTPREKCHLSTRSYPYLLALNMNLARDNPQQWDTVACSGAIIYDANSVNENGYEGQWNGQGDKGLGRLHGFSNKAALETQALNEMIPGRTKQIEFVKKYKPRVITLTMGGNDIGFGDKLKQCATPLTLTPTCDLTTTTGRAGLATEIKDQYDSLKSLYQELYTASDNTAKIYVLGYPQFINSDSSGVCTDQNVGELNPSEREMIGNSVTYLNNVIEQAAKAAGVKYIDIEDSLAGHKLCDSGTKYVTGVTNIFGWHGDEPQESFHPNVDGQKAIAAAVESAVDNESLLTYDICSDAVVNLCIDSSATKDSITVPSYFQGQPVQTKTAHSNFSLGDIVKNTVTAITTPTYVLAPSSSVSITLHSDPVDLGQYTTSSDGVLNAEVSIPSTLPVGYHTLIVSGQTYSGEPIEYEQTVLVTGSDPDDLDDNGISDAQQACGAFITPSGIDADLDGIDDACDPQISNTPQLYRMREGDVSRTYSGSPEHENYLYIERNTRASSITGIAGEYDPDGDGWAIVGISEGTPYTTTSVPDTAPAANFVVIGQGTSSKPYVYIRAGGYGCVSFTPTSLAKVEQGQDRTIKKVDYNTDKCRQEDPSDDVDGNGLADNTQPLYTARSGDATKGEDPSRIYLYRNFYSSEAQLGISDYTPTGTPAGNPNQPIQPWNLLASSKPGEYVPAFNKLVILEDSNGKPLPTILTKKQNGQCIAYQPSSTSIIKFNQTNYLAKLASLPGGVSCE